MKECVEGEEEQGKERVEGEHVREEGRKSKWEKGEGEQEKERVEGEQVREEGREGK